MFHRIFAIAATALLGACAGGYSNIQTSSAPSAAPPGEWRAMTLAHLRRSLKDPYSVRDAEIAAPYLAAGPSLMPSGFGTPWIVCVSANSKNTFGAYAGKSPIVVLIYEGKVETSHENGAWAIACNDVKYEPFPELMQTV